MTKLQNIAETLIGWGVALADEHTGLQPTGYPNADRFYGNVVDKPLIGLGRLATFTGAVILHALSNQSK